MTDIEKWWQENKAQLWSFWQGYKEFQKSGETPLDSYYAMRNLYVKTNGWFNDIFQRLYSINHPAKPIKSFRNSFMCDVTASDVRAAVKGLDKNGYYIFPDRIPENYIDELVKFSMQNPTILQSDDHTAETNNVFFDPENLVATNYRFTQEQVINNETAQAIMADPVLLSVVQNYFRSQAMYCNVHMWWTTPYRCNEPSSTLAQLFHYDMDRFKFLNFFIYLTDVNTNNGPHCFIRTSHRRKPAALLEDRRFQDSEIKAHYDDADHIEITGKRGTIMAVDGRGFHKAKVPTQGNRLIFLISMSSSLFGQNYTRVPLQVKNPMLGEAISRDKELCSAYNVSYQAKEQSNKVLVPSR